MSKSSRPNRVFRCLSATVLTIGVVTLTGSTQARAASSPIVEGSARFQVLTPTLIRVEYSADGLFEDRPTFNAINRNLPAAAYTTSVTSDDYREIRTSALVLRYKRNSGPLGPTNTSVQLTVAGQQLTARPAFPPRAGPTCAFGVWCEAEKGTLSGNISVATNHANYTGTGFVDRFEQVGDSVRLQILDVPVAGTYGLTVRYANDRGAGGQVVTKTLSAQVGGQTAGQLALVPTNNWDSWGTATVNVSLAAGANTIAVTRTSADSGSVNIDSIALVHQGAGSSPSNLKGYRRGLDTFSGPAPMADGLLARDGWYLLDDTGTALLNADNTTTPRVDHKGAAYQDGYLFGYGHNYKQALKDLRDLTGPAPLLPRWAFGVWYSRWYSHTEADYRDSVLPGFRSHGVPIDVLVVDTDWKSPASWNGWNWNSSLFPDPQRFLTWTKQQGLQVSLNIHPSIQDNDPKYASAKAVAGKDLPVNSCTTNPTVCKRNFDFGDPKQLAAYFSLHTPFEQQGVRLWWLDMNAGESPNGPAGVTQDTWINSQYALRATSASQRGFAFSRIAGSGSDYAGFTPAPTGPWAEHRSTVAFTADTYPTWDMLSFQAYLTARESAGIGLPYISHDVGGFFGDTAYARSGHDDDDLYARWVQMATFHPILRLHSAQGDRLPWQYGIAEAPAEKFLRLREALVPYSYSLARQAVDTGLPMVRALYLNYPESPEAYSADREFLYGDDLLVAPVTTPGIGSVNTPVWFPPGIWTDYFSGKTYVGPTTATVINDLSTLPVFLRSGGVVATRTDYVDNQLQSPPSQITLDVSGGGSGTFTLYDDAGEGLGYQKGEFTTTAITSSDIVNGSQTSIAPRQGSFTGQLTSRQWTVRFHNANKPTTVTVNGAVLGSTLSGVGWSYDPPTRTLTVRTALMLTSSKTDVRFTTGANGASGPITGLASKCVDVSNSNTANGTGVQLWTCAETPAQLWTVGAGSTLQALGKCLDAGGQTTSGTLMQLWDCNGTNSQVWQPRADGSIFHPASGLCLDIPNASTQDGTRLQLYTCNGSTAQKWAPPTGSGT